MNLALIIPGNLMEILIICNFWFSTLTLRFDKKKSLMAYFVVQLLGAFRNWMLMDHVLLKSFLATTCSFALLMILFRDKWYKKLVVFVTYLLCTLAAELVAMFIARYIYNCDLANFVEMSLPYYLWQLTTYTLLLIFTIVALILLKQKKIDPDSRVTQYMFLYLSVQCLTVVMFTMTMFHYRLMSSLMFLLVLFTLLASGFVAVVIYGMLKRATEEAAEADYLRKDAETKDRHFMEIREQYMEFRKLRHDYLNHLRVLKELHLSENAEAYTVELESKLMQMEQISYCDNATLDALLSVKKRTAEQVQVSLIPEICSLQNITVSDFDLCTVVSNLLDNAIEAAKQTEKKGVFMQISRKMGRLIITVKNTSLPVSPQLKTTKKDKSNHGIGIENIRTVAAKYDGDYVHRYENGEFVASVNLAL